MYAAKPSSWQASLPRLAWDAAVAPRRGPPCLASNACSSAMQVGSFPADHWRCVCLQTAFLSMVCDVYSVPASASKRTSCAIATRLSQHNMCGEGRSKLRGQQDGACRRTIDNCPLRVRRPVLRRRPRRLRTPHGGAQLVIAAAAAVLAGAAAAARCAQLLRARRRCDRRRDRRGRPARTRRPAAVWLSKRCDRPQPLR